MQELVQPILDKHHLTIRERKALVALVEGKTVSQAAREAGYAYHSAVSNQLNGRNSRLRAAFLEAMDALGLSDAKILQKLRQVTNATTAKWNPNKKQWDHFPDHAVQLKALDMALKLKGHYPRAGEAKEPVPVTIVTSLFDGLGPPCGPVGQGVSRARDDECIEVEYRRVPDEERAR